jgi:hypothetical protein
VTPADRDVKLNRLKALAEKLANKVNAPGDMPEVRLGAVASRVDEVALHGVRLGTALGLAAMSTRTGGRLLHAAARLRRWRAGGP